MYRTSPRRRGATRPQTAVAVTAISIAAHALVLWAVGTNIGRRLSSPHSSPAAEAAKAAKPPLPSCEADEALASAARLVYCALPNAGGESCMRAAVADFNRGRERCTRVELPAEVALLDPAVLDQIEPEPLMDLIDPEVLREIQLAQEQPPEPPPDQPPPEDPLAEPPPELAQTPPPPPEAQRPPPPPQPTQVVEITPPESDEAPEDSRFLADFDSKVEKQTVARGTTEEMVAKPEPSSVQPEDIPNPRADQPLNDNAGNDPSATGGPGRLAMRALGLPEQGREAKPVLDPGLENGSEAAPTEGGMLARKGSSESAQEAREATDPRQGENGGGGGGRALPNLRPTEDVLDRALGGGSVDHLDDVAEGDTTALNAKQWKFASFFNRVKRQVAQNWNPARVMAMRDPTGKVYGVRNRITYLEVILDPQGAVRAIHVVRSSGVDELDEEAVRAFRAAQPFPNPPDGLVDGRSQRISFMFGFHLDMAARSSWRLLRR